MLKIEVTEEFEKLARECIDVWGVKDQISVAQEECAEFLVASSHLRRKRPTAIEEAIEETADCLVVMHEMAVLLGVDKVNEVIDSKLNRVKQRLSKARQEGKHGIQD